MFFVQNLAFSQEAKLTDIIVTNTRDDLLVYLSVEGAFREKMQEAILSGVPTTFSFFITLFKTRNLWLDKKMADIKVTHSVKYNNLKKETGILTKTIYVFITYYYNNYDSKSDYFIDTTTNFINLIRKEEYAKNILENNEYRKLLSYI